MTTLKKTVLSTKLLFFTYLSKIKKLKEFTTLLKVLFGLFWLNKNFLSYYELRLLKQQSTYKIEVLSAKILLLYTKISKVKNHILVIFVFLDVKFGFIYLKKSIKSLMIDFIRAFIMPMKATISIKYMILTMVEFLS